jgi:hypothetical protein
VTQILDLADGACVFQAPATTNHALDTRDVAGAPKWMVGVITRLPARKLTPVEGSSFFHAPPRLKHLRYVQLTPDGSRLLTGEERRRNRLKMRVDRGLGFRSNSTVYGFAAIKSQATRVRSLRCRSKYSLPSQVPVTRHRSSQVRDSVRLLVFSMTTTCRLYGRTVGLSAARCSWW